MIRIIPTRIHGILDYLSGALMIALPWILGFSQYSGALWVMFMLGIVVIVYSVITRYEMGLAGLISMRTHLWFEFLVGGFLLASPWLLGFAEYVYMPHVVMGGLSVVVAMLTRTSPTKVHGPQLSPRKPHAAI